MTTTRAIRLAAGVGLIVAALHTSGAAQQPSDTIPFDPAVRTLTLPNGLSVFVRQNARPAKRLALRLAVKAGSMNEADDQQGLAHFLEHMAFNGSTHFKPGELVSYFESIGARLGPHLNAYTSFDETVYMFELPSDNPEAVAKGLTALADFAAGDTLDPAEVDRERGVVIEEWRGGLGAGSRIRDKQLPLLFDRSRYAERLPIGKPDVIRTAPAARLRAFYDTWYRPDRMAVVAVGDVDAEALTNQIRTTFSGIAARAPAQADPDRSVPLQAQTLVGVASDPELTQSAVSIVRKRPRETGQRVADYRRDLVDQLMDRMIGERFGEIARRPDAAFLGASAGTGTLGRTVDTFSLRAAVADGKIQDGLRALAVEATRVRDLGFGPAELDRAKRTMSAFYDRAYNEREKTESGSFAQEYLNYFLDQEPAPGIEFERRLVQQLLPTIAASEIAERARTWLGADSRVVLATSPQKTGLAVPSEADLTRAIEAGDHAAVTAWNDAGGSQTLLPENPAAAPVVSTRTLPALGVTIVEFPNGVTAWLKPTDFKNDQVIFTLQAPGGASLAPAEHYMDASLATALVSLSGVGGIKALDLQKLLTGKLVGASPFIGLSTHGISGSAAPADLETALQLLYLNFTAPNDDPDAFALLVRQLGAQVANRDQSPQQVFGERVAALNSSNHYTAQPLTPERVAALDRARMLAFYRQRFSNPGTFTFFMVGSFTVADAVPLIARYVGSLPAPNPQTASRWADAGIRFPQAVGRVRVEKGREPRAQTVLSFFADPDPDPVAQEIVAETTDVLDIALRDILREALGQTYSVNVGLSEPLPQRGAGHIQIRFGSAPENAEAMTDRVLKEIARLQKEGPTADLVNRAKESARRTYETSMRDNGYWLRRLSAIQLLGGKPDDLLTRGQRIDAITPAAVHDAFIRYFPLDRYTVATLVPEPAAR